MPIHCWVSKCNFSQSGSAFTKLEKESALKNNVTCEYDVFTNTMLLFYSSIPKIVIALVRRLDYLWRMLLSYMFAHNHHLFLKHLGVVVTNILGNHFLCLLWARCGELSSCQFKFTCKWCFVLMAHTVKCTTIDMEYNMHVGVNWEIWIQHPWPHPPCP